MDVRVGLWRKLSALMCWRRLLRAPWTARGSNQSILKEIGPVFFGKTGAKAETPILCPLDAKSWLIGKDSDAGRDWGQEEKGTTEDGWMASPTRRTWVWVISPGVGDGQGGLACCNSWGRKELDTTERLNWTEDKYSTQDTIQNTGYKYNIWQK